MKRIKDMTKDELYKLRQKQAQKSYETKNRQHAELHTALAKLLFKGANNG